MRRVILRVFLDKYKALEKGSLYKKRGKEYDKNRW